MLLLSGGASNPFSILYIIHVAIAGIALAGEAAAAVFALTGLCYLVLQVGGLPLHLDQHGMFEEATLIRLGHFAAFAATAGSVGYFVLGMSNSLRKRVRQLREARARLGEPNTEEMSLEEAMDAAARDSEGDYI